MDVQRFFRLLFSSRTTTQKAGRDITGEAAAGEEWQNRDRPTAVLSYRRRREPGEPIGSDAAELIRAAKYFAGHKE